MARDNIDINIDEALSSLLRTELGENGVLRGLDHTTDDDNLRNMLQLVSSGIGTFAAGKGGVAGLCVFGGLTVLDTVCKTYKMRLEHETERLRLEKLESVLVSYMKMRQASFQSHHCETCSVVSDALDKGFDVTITMTNSKKSIRMEPPRDNNREVRHRRMNNEHQAIVQQPNNQPVQDNPSLQNYVLYCVMACIFVHLLFNYFQHKGLSS